MAKRRVKKRTQPAPSNNGAMDRSPKSMVIRIGAGEVGSSVSQLVKDVRHVMEPGTAARLKERRANKLRDYTTMASPLGVTHLLLFSRSESGNTNLRLARTPRGPTLHFRVEQYALCKDVLKAQRRPHSGGFEFQTAPLLVMNNFITPEAAVEAVVKNGVDGVVKPGPPPKHLEKLVTEMFQGLFPPISPQTTPLTSIRRVLLMNREPPTKEENGTYTINLRHYAITTKVMGLPKSIRRLNAAEKLKGNNKKRSALPNLGKLDDVADYLLGPDAGGYTSASETEIDSDAEVEVLATSARKILSKRDRAAAPERPDGHKSASRGGKGKVEKRAVKLVELGPRMKLRLTKVEEEICGGKVLWHEYVNKSATEVKKMNTTWEKRKREKEERRRVQKENIERKRKEKGGKNGKEGENEEDEDEEDYDMDDDVWDEDGEGDEDEEMEDGHGAGG
ncbi:Brix-domain-containing protein [Mytilinidion resinicola]|uniref:Brix-domain-containing protein n=1 Tax=Mytilinidion resinicola TaxID=574789 RepID=A0A6A6XYQ3_9PEZI|nr:Brix-domain-containing protein [Mytilinidion resinicola]KAF2801550.1 Brix-domain-containing protein [Mytilinidion resinicola]